MYVGKSTHLRLRLIAHRSRTFQSVFIIRSTPKEVGRLERVWIAKLRPKWNRRIPGQYTDKFLAKKRAFARAAKKFKERNRDFRIMNKVTSTSLKTFLKRCGI
jgi:hypothetical protein